MSRIVQDLIGRGALFSPRPLFGYALGGIRDAGFGVYAKCSHLKAVLEDRWAGEPAAYITPLPCVMPH